MRPIILRNVPQQSRIAVRVDEVATEDVPGWTNIGVSAAKLSGVALVDEKVEHARSLLELVANRHRVLVLLRAEAIGFVEDQAEHVGITFDALLVERTHNAGEQHIAARARGDGLPHLREKGRHEVAFGRLLRLAVRKFCHVHRERPPRIGLDELAPAEGLSHATVAFDPEGVATHLDACSGGTGEALAGTGENQGPLVAKKRMDRSEEHTSELQSLMRISYAVFCLKKKKNR